VGLAAFYALPNKAPSAPGPDHTSRTPTIVSLMAVVTMALTFGACAGHRSSPVADSPATIERELLAIRFDNYAREHVHVYLVSEKRQWLLGKVEPGARASLRIPEAALLDDARFVQLAVLTGERINLQVVRDARATFTTAQPASTILSQRWNFTHGQLTSTGLWGTRRGR
jgi:hypothetical protein